MEVGGTVDSIMGKLPLISEYNLAMEVEMCIKPTSEFQPPTHVPGFKLFNLRIIIRLQFFIV
jgi:hypothetical protein